MPSHITTIAAFFAASRTGARAGAALSTLCGQGSTTMGAIPLAAATKMTAADLDLADVCAQCRAELKATRDATAEKR